MRLAFPLSAPKTCGDGLVQDMNKVGLSSICPEGLCETGGSREIQSFRLAYLQKYFTDRSGHPDLCQIVHSSKPFETERRKDVSARQRVLAACEDIQAPASVWQLTTSSAGDDIFDLL